MLINIIHLPHRIDRFESFRSELACNNIQDFRIWPGILNRKAPRIGISQAHKQIVRWAKYHNQSEVLIAEDDFHFTSKFSFRYFLNQKPLEYDLFLASVYHGKIDENNRVCVFSGLTFYLINQNFYDIFLSTPEDNHLDYNLSNKGKFIVCNPFPVIQHNGFSDNSNRMCNYDLYLEGRQILRDDQPR